MPPKSALEFYHSKAVSRRSAYSKQSCSDARALLKKLQADIKADAAKYVEEGDDENVALEKAKHKMIGYVVWGVNPSETKKPCNFSPYFWVSGETPSSKDNLREIQASGSKLFLDPEEKLPEKVLWEDFIEDATAEKKIRGQRYGKELFVKIPFADASSDALKILRENGHSAVPRFDPLSAVVSASDDADGSEFDEDVDAAPVAKPKQKSAPKASTAEDSLDEDAMDVDTSAPKKSTEKKKKQQQTAKASASKNKKKATESLDDSDEPPAPKTSKKRKAEAITPPATDSLYITAASIKSLLEKHPVISAEIQSFLSQKHHQENLKKFATSEALTVESLVKITNILSRKPEKGYVSPAILFRIVATCMMPAVNFVEAKCHQYMDQKSIRPLITTPDSQVAFLRQKDTIQFIKNLVRLTRLNDNACKNILRTYAKYESLDAMGVVAVRQTKDTADADAAKAAARIKELCRSMTKMGYFNIIRPAKGGESSPASDFNADIVEKCGATSMLTEVPLEKNNAATMLMFHESKDKKSELIVSAFAAEDMFKMRDGEAEDPTFTIPTILFYGHPNAHRVASETPKKPARQAKKAASSDASEMPPPADKVETVQKQRASSSAMDLLSRNNKKTKSSTNHGNVNIVSPLAMKTGKWYRVSADTMRALGYTKDTQELFVTITPVLQSFFKFIESEGKRDDVIKWFDVFNAEDSKPDEAADRIFEMLFVLNTDDAELLATNVYQYSILKEFVATSLPAGVKAEEGYVHLNAGSHALKVILGKTPTCAKILEKSSTAKKSGINYLKAEETFKNIDVDEAGMVVVWLCFAGSIFGITSASKKNAPEALVANWNKFFQTLEGAQEDQDAAE